MRIAPCGGISRETGFSGRLGGSPNKDTCLQKHADCSRSVGEACLRGIRSTNSPPHCQSETSACAPPKRNGLAVEGMIFERSEAQPPAAALHKGSAAVSPLTAVSPDEEFLPVREASSSPTFQTNPR